MPIFTGILLLDTLGVVAAFVAVFFAYLIWSYQYWKRKNVPYLEPTIPFGNVTDVILGRESVHGMIRSLYEKARDKGWRQCGIYSLAKPVYLLVDLELTKHIMTKDFGNFVDRGTYFNEKDDPLGCHLFAIGGKKWRNLRVKFSPTFTSAKLRMMFQTLVDCGVILEKYLQENVTEMEAVDIKDVFARFTIDVIGSCAFGLECNTFKDPYLPFRVYGEKVFNFNKWQSLRFSLASNFPDLGRMLRIRSIGKDVSDFFTKVVEDTVTYREKNQYRRNDFLQLLIDMKNNKDSDGEGVGETLTMDELAAQCFIFFLAGFETSSTTATFVLYELAKNQEIQDKLREEIKAVLTKHDNRMTYDSLSELTYMKQVMDEALRMYPPLSVVTRLCTEDYKIPGEDLVLEKNTRIFIPIVGFHYDKEYYENPTVFDPDRFSEGNKKKRHPYAHIPFGEGPRVCIGQRFGIMQTKVGLTSILRNFRVTLNDKTQTPLKLSRTSLVTSAQGGVWLNFHKI